MKQVRIGSAAVAIFLTAAMLGGSSEKARRPHPDALPNPHKPGEVDNPKLVPFIVKQPGELPGIVVDETEATLVGQWRYSTHTPPYVGLGYLHDQKMGKGSSSVTYTPELPSGGEYEVRLSHCYNIRRATNTLVTIHHAEGETTLRINQQSTPEHGRLFRSLGKYHFNKGRQGWVRISTDGTEGKYVIADAIQFLPVADQCSHRRSVSRGLRRHTVPGKAPWIYGDRYASAGRRRTPAALHLLAARELRKPRSGNLPNSPQ